MHLWAKILWTALVTLHVSVWVEITAIRRFHTGRVSRSTWACELKSSFYDGKNKRAWSRSTWACELKLIVLGFANFKSSHAPRERVSWNQQFCYISRLGHSVTLHVSVWVEISFGCGSWIWTNESRSTWACELKLFFTFESYRYGGHAPRERVSWNSFVLRLPCYHLVTLHVSVWVEIAHCCAIRLCHWSSRSTWACELKFW